MANKSISKKVDYLAFQRNLNEQFLEIFKNKSIVKNSSIDEHTAIDMLGLVTDIGGLLFFIPLNDLLLIADTENIEILFNTKKWIVGFTQERGHVFTIIDLQKTLDEILNKDVQNSNEIGLNARLLYFKINELANLAVLSNDVNLEYTAEFTKLFLFEDNKFKKLEGIDFSMFILEKNMKQNEWLLVNKINSFVDKEIVETEVIENKLLYLIKDIFLDGMGKRPIFVLNTDKLINQVLKLSPL